MVRIFRRVISLIKILYLKYGKKFNISLNAYLSPGSKIIIRNGKIKISEFVHLRSDSLGYHAGMPFPTTVLIDNKDAYVEIGEHSRLNGVYIHAQKEIIIGENCVIAAGVNILDSNGHELISTNRTIGRDRPESIIIGNNVWIGLNAVVLKGTTIGDNSVVGANSVVKGVFAKNSLIVGNPGRLVKVLTIEESGG